MLSASAVLKAENASSPKAGIVAAAALALLVGSGVARADVIYDSLTGGKQGFSEGYDCCSIVELGDQIQFSGNARNLTTVTVNMDQFPITTPTPPTPYTIPLTLNLYNSTPGGAGTLISSDTVDVNITPSATDESHFNVNFNFTGVIVPNTIFYGLAFQTSLNGGPPDDEANALNFTLWNESGSAFGSLDGPIPVGTDVSNIVYSRHTNASPLVDDGPANDLDDGFTPAIQFNAVPEPASMALLGTALLGFAGIRTRIRRRRKV